MKDKYQHYKGDYYHVMGIGKHSETNEEVVIYQNLHDKKIWVRPKAMFFENIKLNGHEFPRFKKVKMTFSKVLFNISVIILILALIAQGFILYKLFMLDY